MADPIDISVATGTLTRGDPEIASASTTPVLSQRTSVGDYHKRGVPLSDLKVTSFQGLEINDKTQMVDDTPTLNVFFNPKVDRVALFAPVSRAAGSIGIQWTKAFNGRITTGEIRDFEIGLLMQGSDNNVVEGERIWGFSKFGVYAASAQTLGKSWYKNLDIVGNQGSGAIHFKATEREVSLTNSYFEVGDTGAKGAIDCSFADMLVFGANTQTSQGLLSINLVGNQIDSPERFTNFLTRIYPNNAVLIRVEHRQPTSFTSAPSFFCDLAGAPVQHFPLHGPAFRARQIYINDPTFGPDWDGFQSAGAVTRSGDGYRIDAQNGISVTYNTIVTGTDGVAHVGGKKIVIPAGKANKSIGIFPGGFPNANSYFAVGRIYEVILTARSTAATGDTVSVQQVGLDGTGTPFGVAWTSFALTSQEQVFRLLVPGRPSNYQACGFNVQSATSTGDIYFDIFWREAVGTWTAPLQLGTAYYWTNATTNVLRTRPATALPTSDNDGVVVGSQT